MAFDPNLAVEQLIAIYKQAYVKILERIADREARGNSTEFERTLLRDVTQILLELDFVVEHWAEQVIPRIYQGSAAEAIRAWTKSGLKPPNLNASFAQVHRAAVETLVSNFTANLHEANAFVGRRIRDEFRRAQLRAVTEKVTTGQTVRDAKKELQRRLMEQGLTAFRDAAGRVWRLDAYAEMAVRSVTAEATNMGLVNQLRGMGYDLVRITEHHAPCPICAPLEGRVYSISGKDPRYPKLEVAMGEYMHIHPNCRHRVVPYIEELDPNPEATRRKSNRPLDYDPRSEAEKRAYEREQRMNRLRRQRRRLEEQLAVAPEEEKDTIREKLRRIRGEQQRLGRERNLYIDEVTDNPQRSAQPRR